MNKFILFLAMLFLLPKENCFATKRLLEGEASAPESKKSGISSQTYAKLDDLPKDIFNHVCPDYIQRHLRICTQGDTDKLLQLYKEAEKKNIPLAQIHLANAYHIAKSNDDYKKNFTNIREPKQLEPYGHLVKQKYFPLKRMIGKLHPHLGSQEEERLVFDIFKKAMDQGSIYAKVVQIIEHSWNELGFSNAAQLRPLLDKSAFSELNFLYGKSLFCGSPSGSRFMYEGIKYMHKSKLLTLKFYEEEKTKKTIHEPQYQWLYTLEDKSYQNFEEYCDHYVLNMKIFNSYFDMNGLRFVGSNIILAPSRKYWKKFLTKYIKEIQLSSLSTFDFIYTADLVSLGNIYNNLEIDLEPSSDKDHNIESVIVYQKDKELGQIAVELFDKNIDNHDFLFNKKPKHHSLYKMIKTIDVNETETNLNPLIKFMENFMKNCGDGASIDHFFSSYACYKEKSLIGLNFGHS